MLKLKQTLTIAFLKIKTEKKARKTKKTIFIFSF